MRNGRIIRLRAYLLAGLALISMLLFGCAATTDENPAATTTPDSTNSTAKQSALIPEKLTKNDAGVPILNVYQTDEEAIAEMDLETYLEGVLAGEMKDDWPMEALKAQAILARTFVLKFCTEKKSQYEGADISTDIKEAQAYDATGVNERILQAVKETKGQVLVNGSELPYAWFHAHSGGMTTHAKTGLDYEGSEPNYTKITEGRESDQAPADAKSWKYTASEKDFLAAAKRAGLGEAQTLESVEAGEKDKGGHVKDIVINGQKVSAARLRIELGSTEMRSTLLESIELKDRSVLMSGKGYGHGVGMPQWGSYAMAEEGQTAEDIVLYYFDNVTVEKLW